MVNSPIQVDVAAAGLRPAPINPSWIIDGTPTARCASLARSADGRAWTDLWDCTAGSFHWQYDIDETIFVLAGSAVITDGNGLSWPLLPNDVMHFKAGMRAQWQVQDYVRKIAFCSEPKGQLIGLVWAKNRIRELGHRMRR